MLSPANPLADRVVSFGPFRLSVSQQLLSENGKPVRLGIRAFGLLVTLVGRAGVLVSKEDLFAAVWPDTVVEENTLRVHMAALRRTLGDGQTGNRYIATIPGHGYIFVAQLSQVDGPSPPSPLVTPAISTQQKHNLPMLPTRMVGRTEIIDSLLANLPRWRFITLVGLGGMGKTTVALAAADALLTKFPDQVCFVNFAQLTDPQLVPTAVSLALDLPTRTDNPLGDLISFLADKEILLVLDGCEHVIEAAAVLVERLIERTRRVHILATSREPLGVAGEHVQRLRPLGLPVSAQAIGAESAQRFPAIQLFVERATAIIEGFELTDADAPVAVEICRKLDGMPLAIEMAASRVDAFGLHGLAAHLDDRFAILTRGRRSAVQRHQTLRAMLDWSYDLLSDAERSLLKRLAIFRGLFTLEAVYAVAATEEAGKGTIDGLANLVKKSLVAAEIGDADVHYRLLDTTRAYALEKLKESDQFDVFARRHAEYYRRVFERAEEESAARPASEWLTDYAREIDNLRAAVDWAFSLGGDQSIGIALTAAAVPLWMLLSLFGECCSRAKLALAAVGTSGTRPEMRLKAALATSMIYASGVGPEVGPALTSALAIAETLHDAEYQLWSTWGLWVFHVETSQYRAALEAAQRFCILAAERRQESDRLIGERMVGVSYHLLGDQPTARRHIEHMLAHYVSPVQKPPFVRFTIDQLVAANAALARVLWLQGFPDEAMRRAKTTFERAGKINNGLSLCYALAHACPIALWVEDLAAADHYITMLLDHTKHALPSWHAMGCAFRGILDIKRGDVRPGLQLLRGGFERPLFGWISAMFLSELAAGFARAGQIADGLAVADRAINQVERTEGRWVLPESLRIKGELLLLQAAEGAAAAAELLFQQALECARRQGELSWELRTATSLARLRRNEGRPAHAIACLEPIYNRFTEGFATADLTAAKQLLVDLVNAGRS